VIELPSQGERGMIARTGDAHGYLIVSTHLLSGRV
jgi:hypothetical protein